MEWLSATDNIAILVLALGYGPMCYALRMLWQALQESQRREAAALREGVDLERSYTAQLDSMASVLSATQRAQEEAARKIEDGFRRMESLLRPGSRS